MGAHPSRWLQFAQLLRVRLPGLRGGAACWSCGSHGGCTGVRRRAVCLHLFARIVVTSRHARTTIKPENHGDGSQACDVWLRGAACDISLARTANDMLG